MSIKSKINSHKKYNPVLKQTTIRISKESLERIKKYAKENKIKEGTLLRILIEDGIEKIDGPGKQEVEGPVVALSEDVAFLRKQVRELRQVVYKISADLGNDLEESLSPDSSNNIETEAANDPRDLAPDSNQDTV